MHEQPNILFLMTDQMQARVLDADHQCLTPNLDALAARGVRIRNAYTPNAVCSPARASLMTGLLPHNHGVLVVTHCADDDQSCLREDLPHWGQHLRDAGYRTGYFGKWHIERSNDLERFGWDTAMSDKWIGMRNWKSSQEWSFSLKKNYSEETGYNDQLFYGVVDVPAERRGVGAVTGAALEFLDEAMAGDEPWCCVASCTEPHDPFVCGQDAFDLYDVDTTELAPNVFDESANRPGIYRKSARVWEGMTERERREAAACYYASITEIDAQYGRIIDRVRAAGQLDNTIIVFTTDHGELLGAHGLYCKNFSAYEEVYNVPLIVAGPGVAAHGAVDARVGTHDLCPTLLELAGAEPIDNADSASFAGLLADPQGTADHFTRGFAEYFGTRMYLTQRVTWDGDWKLVFNGFDFDELYDLAEDPWEMNNLAEDPAHAGELRRMFSIMWDYVERTGDHVLLRSHYPILRVASYGPNVNADRG